MHFGAPANGVFPLVSMLGDLVPRRHRAPRSRSSGAAQPRVAMTFLGEGAFSVGDTHEGLNLAAVWQVPAVFVIQANRYSYSTPVARQMVNTNIAQRIYGGWSIPAERVDGTDALAVLDDRPGGRRAGAQRQRPAGGRGAHGAHARARRARRLALRAGGDARGVLRALRPGRAASRRGSRSTASARREIDEMREAATAEVAAGLAEAEQAPAPDPATLEDGVYAAPPLVARGGLARQQPAQHQVDQRRRASAPGSQSCARRRWR